MRFALAILLAATASFADTPATTSAPASAPASGPASRPSFRSRMGRTAASAPAPLPAVPWLTLNEPPKQLPIGNITEGVYKAALDWLDNEAPARIKELTAPAEAAAARLLDGGWLYVAGNGGFCDEFDNRAGIFSFDRVWHEEPLLKNDVLLVGEFRPNEMESRKARLDNFGKPDPRFKDALVIHLSSHNWPQTARSLPAIHRDWWKGRLWTIDTAAPDGAGWEDVCVGQLATTFLGIALHGEIMAAGTRQGKTLAAYGSDAEPGCPAWDAFVRDKHIHPDYKVPPIPAGEIAEKYRQICRQQIADFLSTQDGPGMVRLGAKRLAEVMRGGGVVWAIIDGHIHGRGALLPRELTRLKMFGRSYNWHWASSRVPAGDALLWMGYLRYPRWGIESALRNDVSAVVFAVDPGPTNQRLVSIRGCWKDFDTVIDLPGYPDQPRYPIRILPSSGVVQTPQWYALMAEMSAAYMAMPGAPASAPLKR